MEVISPLLQEEDQEVDGHEVTQVRDFQHGCRVTAIAWSPETSLAVIPKALRLYNLQLCLFCHFATYVFLN